jgi:hypothetical protein
MELEELEVVVELEEVLMTELLFLLLDAKLD